MKTAGCKLKRTSGGLALPLFLYIRKYMGRGGSFPALVFPRGRCHLQCVRLF